MITLIYCHIYKHTQWTCIMYMYSMYTTRVYTVSVSESHVVHTWTSSLSCCTLVLAGRGRGPFFTPSPVGMEDLVKIGHQTGTLHDNQQVSVDALSVWLPRGAVWKVTWTPVTCRRHHVSHSTSSTIHILYVYRR